MNLAAWAERNGVARVTAYRWFRAGLLPVPVPAVHSCERFGTAPLAFVPAIALAGISGNHVNESFRAGAALGVGLTRRGTSQGGNRSTTPLTH